MSLCWSKSPEHHHTSAAMKSVTTALHIRQWLFSCALLKLSHPCGLERLGILNSTLSFPVFLLEVNIWCSFNFVSIIHFTNFYAKCMSSSQMPHPRQGLYYIQAIIFPFEALEDYIFLITYFAFLGQ